MRRELSAPMSWWQRLLCIDLNIPYVMHNVQIQRQKLGGGLFLTEFGLCLPDAYNDSLNTVLCQSILAEVMGFLKSPNFRVPQFGV